jgi:hypothetical protein
MRTPSLAALLLLAACGKPLLYGEVEIPSVAVKVPQQTFDAITGTDLCTTPGTSPSNLCSLTSIKYDLGNEFRDLVKDATSLDLRLTELAIDLTTLDPINNPLAGFERVAQVRILAVGEAPLVALELARYTRDPAAPAGRGITVSARSSVNLGPYVQGGLIEIRAELEVDPPSGLPAFTADVTGDFYLKVMVDWGKKAGVL